MDRKLCSFFLGALLSLFLPIVPAFSYVIFFTLLCGVCFLFKQHIFAVFLLGIIWLLFHAASYNHIWSKNAINTIDFFENKHLVTGKITSLISANNIIDQRFNFQIEKIDKVNLVTPMQVRLSWRHVKRDKNLNANASDLNNKEMNTSHLGQGQYWQLKVKLKPAHGLANQGGFHYQTWLRAKNLSASGYVLPESAALLQNSLTLRQQLYNRTHQKLAGSVNAKISRESLAIMSALTFGDRSFLNKADWQLFTVTGTQHLIAISGLHVALVAGACYYFLLSLRRLLPFYFLPKRWQHYMSYLPSYYGVVVLSLMVITWYGYLAGFSSPTLRAITMISIFWLAKLFNISMSRTRLILLTAVVHLLFVPMSLITASFWLSFYAVCIIFFTHWLFYHYFLPKALWLKVVVSIVLMQLALSVFMLPIAGFLQYQIPLGALPANLVAVPFMSFIILPIMLLSWFCLILTLPLADSFLQLTDLVTTLFLSYLSVFQPFDTLMITVGQTTLVMMLLILFISLYLYIRPKTYSFSALWLFSVFTCGVLFLFCLWTLSATNINKKNNWQLVVLDVGQGSAYAIIKNGHAILYDVGARYPSGFILAEAVVVPFLKSQQITTIDKLILSHSDNDHSGGFAWLKQYYSVNEVIANDQKFAPNLPCSAPKIINWQGLTLHILWPPSSVDDISTRQGNDQSCVIMITDGVHRVLLPGDISSRIEKQLVNLYPEALRADVLLAPHHGSKSSSSPAFLATVNPQYAVFSAGFMNRWNMPSQAVLKRFQPLHIKTLQTANSGMITFNFDKESIDVVEYKKHQHHYWFAN